MHSHLSEFLLLAFAHLMAVASPGPDFAIVLRQSLVSGRRAALLTSLGIGTAILVHVTYSLLGIGVMIQSSDTAFAVVKWAGALYLLWLAWQGLRARPAIDDGADPAALPNPGRGTRHAFVTGFLTNVLNPKATLFFLAVFSVGVSPQTPRLIVACYGLWMAVVTAAWFCLVSIFFTQESAVARFRRNAHWIDRITGLVLILFAVKLVLAERMGAPFGG